MHKLILAVAAMAALCVPAVAQEGGASGQSQNGQHMQPQPGISSGAQTRAGQEVSPQQLSTSQVREIQQALDKKGEKVRVDGKWGPDTEAALKKFQQSQNMSAQRGELDSSTIMALGLEPSGFGLAGTSETTGQAPRGNSQQRTPPSPQNMPQQTPPQGGNGQPK